MKFSITEDFNQTKKSDIQLLFTIIFQDVIDQSKRLMLQCATGESVLRLSKTRLSAIFTKWMETDIKIASVFTSKKYFISTNCTYIMLLFKTLVAADKVENY